MPGAEMILKQAAAAVNGRLHHPNPLVRPCEAEGSAAGQIIGFPGIFGPNIPVLQLVGFVDDFVLGDLLQLFGFNHLSLEPVGKNPVIELRRVNPHFCGNVANIRIRVSRLLVLDHIVIIAFLTGSYDIADVQRIWPGVRSGGFEG
ncbi:hypothetical protein D3C75_723590 [compost metagenome]